MRAAYGALFAPYSVKVGIGAPGSGRAPSLTRMGIHTRLARIRAALGDDGLARDAGERRGF